MDRLDLIHKVCEQIIKDVNIGDYTAIDELLKNVTDVELVAFLPEDEQDETN